MSQLEERGLVKSFGEVVGHLVARADQMLPDRPIELAFAEVVLQALQHNGAAVKLGADGVTSRVDGREGWCQVDGREGCERVLPGSIIAVICSLARRLKRSPAAVRASGKARARRRRCAVALAWVSVRCAIGKE
eukprot:6185636-Pleurochrysis_carterae.AAC.1